MKYPARLAWPFALTLAINALLLVMAPGRSSLDARLYYGAAEALGFLSGLGPRGRSEYLLHECIDVGFIVIYTLFLRELTGHWRLRKGVLGLLIFAPGSADLLETTGILALLSLYPASPSPLAAAVGCCTSLKWTSFAVVSIAVLIGLLRRRPRKATAAHV